MPPRKKLGYNWKARQQKGGDSAKRKRGLINCGDALDSQTEQQRQYEGACEGDTNAFILPEKKARLDLSEIESTQKRKKLSSKQRKRLQKIVEAKERKAKVSYSI